MGAGLRKYLLVIHHPGLANTMYNRLDVHVEGFSDSRERLDTWFAATRARLEAELPGFEFEIYERVDAN